MENIHFTSPFDSKVGFACQVWNQTTMPPIFQEEWALLSPKAVEKRRREFWMGRVAAHQALENLGVSKQAILRGENNEPIWPKGVVGTISHSNDIAVCATAYAKDCDGIGIDVEAINPDVSWDIAERISHPNELYWLEESEEERYKRFFLLFSAKESIFKAFFPQYRTYLDFKDAEIIFPQTTTRKSQLTGRLLKSVASHYPQGYTFSIGYSIQGEYVFTFLKLSSSEKMKSIA